MGVKKALIKIKTVVCIILILLTLVELFYGVDAGIKVWRTYHDSFTICIGVFPYVIGIIINICIILGMYKRKKRPALQNK